MPEKSATNSGMLSLLPPDEVQALFGDPPLLQGEDVDLYNNLMGQFAKLVEPNDMVEWWWVKDITDHSWEIRRLRRFKVLIVESWRDSILLPPHEIILGPGEELPPRNHEKDSARSFMLCIGQYKKVDTLI